MSYSRWSHSVWYTYADVKGGFTVCDERNFSDEELKDIPACIQWFRDNRPRYTEEQLSELEEYMCCYVKDISPGGELSILEILNGEIYEA